MAQERGATLIHERKNRQESTPKVRAVTFSRQGAILPGMRNKGFATWLCRGLGRLRSVLDNTYSISQLGC